MLLTIMCNCNIIANFNFFGGNPIWLVLQTQPVTGSMCIYPLCANNVYFVIARHAQFIVAYFFRFYDIECLLGFALKLMHYGAQAVAMCDYAIPNLDFRNWPVPLCCQHFLVGRHAVIIGH